MTKTPPAPRSPRRRLATVAGGVVAGIVALAGLALCWPIDSPIGGQPAADADPLAVLKAEFERPRFVPHPADNLRGRRP